MTISSSFADGAQEPHGGSSRTWVGVALCVLGTLLSAVGNHLIFKSHARRLDPRRARLLLALGNLCVVVLGTSLGVAALAFAPQALVAPLGGLTIVWNLLLAVLPFFGGVRPKRNEIAATALTLLGTTAIVALGPVDRGHRNSFSVLTKPAFIALALFYSSIGLGFELVRTRNKLYHRIAAGAIGGIVGGLSNVFAKSAIDFHSGKHMIEEAEDMSTFVLVSCIALALAASQLIFLNNALATFPAVQIVPIYQTSLIVAATISGGVAFDEFNEFSILQYLGFVGGVMMSVTGVGFLASMGSSVISSDDMKV